MIKKLILITFLLTTSVNADCKYTATADVVNDELVNKKEHYSCKEKDNFFIQFITEEKYQNSFVIVAMALLENLQKGKNENSNNNDSQFTFNKLY